MTAMEAGKVITNTTTFPTRPDELVCIDAITIDPSMDLLKDLELAR